MDEKPLIKISVRRLVEFILRSGDLDAAQVRGRDKEAMLAGSRIHRKIQKSQTGAYAAEVPLSMDLEYDELTLRIEGRADGIIDEPASEDRERLPVIDEIKGMYLDVTELEQPFPLHLAQAKCYAAMYLTDLEEGRPDRISVQLTYANLETEEIRRLTSEYQYPELTDWFQSVADQYYQWAKWQLLHQKSRNASMEHMEFPFPYRQGQQKLTGAVYHTVKEGQELFLMAPTGVGKTMSCVFPAVRAVGQGYGDIIFYLTAKNETLRAGEEAFRILAERGLDYHVTRITSKEKICPRSEVRCNPVDCPYAKGHFDRVNDAVYAMLTGTEQPSIHDREQILRHAEAFKVCPFEMTLDLASWSDAVLCDYNYVFDPNAHLTRFFGEGAKGDYIFLIDEAHNLADRGREMYSASLTKEHVLQTKRAVGKEQKKLDRALKQLNQILLGMKHDLQERTPSASAGYSDGSLQMLEFSELDRLEYAALHVYEEMQNFFKNSEDAETKEKILDFYFELGDYCAVMQQLDEHYVAYMKEQETERKPGEEKRKTEFSVHLFCVNPAQRLTECIDRGRAAVLFSATLLPLDYFRHLLTTREQPYAIYAESPFPAEHRKLLIANDISTRYRDRSYSTYRKTAQYIAETAAAKTGNYMIFFPSYKMMMDVFRVYRDEFDSDNVNWVVQSPYMGDLDREIFLEDFHEDPEQSLVGFCVMGGVFSEGLDLTGTRLIGAVIVGLGLPQVSPEQELLKQYYDRDRNGFQYAYLYPGMNKVEQAAGRVIRTAEDVGVVVLLDERFLNYDTRRLFPREWNSYEVCTLETIPKQLREFWENPLSH